MLDYTVSYRSEADLEYAVFEENVVNKFTTVTGLTPGTYYDFKVKARNVKGLSVDSAIETILAA